MNFGTEDGHQGIENEFLTGRQLRLVCIDHESDQIDVLDFIGETFVNQFGDLAVCKAVNIVVGLPVAWSVDDGKRVMEMIGLLVDIVDDDVFLLLASRFIVDQLETERVVHVDANHVICQDVDERPLPRTAGAHQQHSLVLFSFSSKSEALDWAAVDSIQWNAVELNIVDVANFGAALFQRFGETYRPSHR